MRPWFPHDKYALTDDKVQALISACGPTGYGVYWAVVERLYTLDNHKLTAKDIPYLCRLLNIDEATMRHVLGTLSAVGLLTRSNSKAWSSQRVSRETAKAEQIAENRRQNLNAYWEKKKSDINKDSDKDINEIKKPNSLDNNNKDKDNNKDSIENVSSEPVREGSEPEGQPETVETIPTNRFGSTGEVFRVQRSMVDSLQAAYPAVDVVAELREIRAWSESNGPKRKTIGGMPRFINSWMAREQDRGGSFRQFSGTSGALPASVVHPDRADRSHDVGKLDLFGGGAK